MKLVIFRKNILGGLKFLLLIINFFFLSQVSHAVAARDTAFSLKVEKVLESATKLNGKPLLNKNNSSTPTAIIFLGQECPISRRFIPTLKELSKTANAQGVQLVGAFADSWATQESSEQFKKDYEIDFPLYWDKDQKLAQLLKPKAKPEAFVLGAQQELLYRGRIDDRFVAIGRLKSQFDQHDLSNAIDAVAKGEIPTVQLTQPVGCLYGEW